MTNQNETRTPTLSPSELARKLDRMAEGWVLALGSDEDGDTRLLRAAALALREREAAPTPTDIDVERVARALHADVLPGDSWETEPVESQIRFRNLARAAIAAMPAPAVPAGWRLVPVEPTEEMERAGAAEVDRTNPYSDDVANNIWTVMLRAAPPAPASEGE
jgi:hypothetical protein